MRAAHGGVRLTVRDLGLLAYPCALQRMQACESEVDAGDANDQLLLVEHPPVITLGRNSRPEHLLLSAGQLAELGIEVHHTGRGGDVTYHGPGQLVGYPVLRLLGAERDAHRYLRRLETVLIATLGDFGVKAQRQPGLTGVWVGDAKIAAIGVRFRRWVTSHGFALNVDPTLKHFDHIVPCGLRGHPVTSLARVLGVTPPMRRVKQALVGRFLEQFG